MGYVPLYEKGDTSPWFAPDLPKLLGYSVPVDYLEFLEAFPETGILDTDVACEGIEGSTWAEDRLYSVAVIFAHCSHPSNDLLGVRSVQYELPHHYVLIGEDEGGNSFCLDLRPEHFGRVVFLFHEEDPGESLVAQSFTDFIRRLRRIPVD
jgi:hypothetical protein